MIPPGVPDFFTRARVGEAGPCRLRGRAWSGQGPIAAVDVSVDGGAAWGGADLGPHLGPFAWMGWSFEWNAPPGEHELVVRATDLTGMTQPTEQPWNHHGLANNMTQRVGVTVRPVD
jgi:hypothetical protein